MNIVLQTPKQEISGTISLPGSKSISNRVLIIKTLSGLNFEIRNLSNSDDTKYLTQALNTFSGASVIDIGHAGTNMRFLTAFLAIKATNIKLTGSLQLQQRPIKELVIALKELGADIQYANQEGFPPLLIKGTEILGGNVSINGNVSSQFISALLLVAPYFKNGLRLNIQKNIVSQPYIYMTIEIMKQFGANVKQIENTIHVSPQTYSFSESYFDVEGDWSAASYFYSLIALSKAGTTLRLNNLKQKTLQADIAAKDIYNNLGVKTTFSNNQVVLEKTSNLIKDNLHIDFTNTPDIAQTLVCTCVAMNVSFTFKGLETLNIKETNRIEALKTEWLKREIFLQTSSNCIDHKATHQTTKERLSISTYNDHRMAMSFAPLALQSNILILNAEVVSKSYPLFWDDLNKIGITHQVVEVTNT